MGWFDFLKRKQVSPPGAGDRGVAVHELMQKLDHRETALRLEACKRLAELGGEASVAVEKLHELLNDEDGEVCLAAAAALSEIER